MKNAILFLNSFCPKSEYPFYKKLAKNKFVIAVDGGLDFVNRIGLQPDIVIGDLDSISKRMQSSLDPDRLFLFPIDKDETDTELALLYCFEERFNKIDIVQPSIGETDHFLANLFLLSRSIPKFSESRYNPKISIINKMSEIMFLRNSKIEIIGKQNEIISVIPISSKIELTTLGTKYTVKNLILSRGETVSVRNRLEKEKAVVAVVGEAFIYHGFMR